MNRCVQNKPVIIIQELPSLFGVGGTFWWGGGTFQLAPGRHFPMSGPCACHTFSSLEILIKYKRVFPRNTHKI